MIDTTKDNWGSALQRDYALGRIEPHYPVPATIGEVEIMTTGNVIIWYTDLQPKRMSNGDVHYVAGIDYGNPIV